MQQFQLFLTGAFIQLIVWGGAILAWFSARRVVHLIHDADEPIGSWLALGVPALTAVLVFFALLKLARGAGR